jgi:hypothetical protein
MAKVLRQLNVDPLFGKLLSSQHIVMRCGRKSQTRLGCRWSSMCGDFKQFFQVVASTVCRTQIRMAQAKRINAHDGGLISFGVVVVFVLFAFLNTFERQTQRCQKGSCPCSLVAVPKTLPMLARVVSKQAGPMGGLGRHGHDQKTSHEASPILKSRQSEVHSLTVCRLSICMPLKVKACSQTLELRLSSSTSSIQPVLGIQKQFLGVQGAWLGIAVSLRRQAVSLAGEPAQCSQHASAMPLPCYALPYLHKL